MKDADKLAVIGAGLALILFFLLREKPTADTGLNPRLTISPTYPILGESTVYLNVRLDNTTDEDIEFTLTVYLNGAYRGSVTRTIAAGDYYWPAWDVTERITQLGLYTAEADLTNLGTGATIHLTETFEVFTEYPY